MGFCNPKFDHCLEREKVWGCTMCLLVSVISVLGEDVHADCVYSVGVFFAGGT